jgi:hypothetical protein
MKHWLPQPSPEELDAFFELVKEQKIDMSREESDQAAVKLLELHYYLLMYEVQKEEEAKNPSPPTTPSFPTSRKKRKQPSLRKKYRRRKPAPTAHKLHTSPKF